MMEASILYTVVRMRQRNAPPAVNDFSYGGTQLWTQTQVSKNIKHERKLKASSCESVYRSMRPVLLVAQFIGLLPISGILGSHHSQLKYSKFSLKSVISAILMSAASTLALTTIPLVIREGLDYRTLGDVIYCSSTALSIIAFYVLAGRWKPMMERWAAVEEAMEGLPSFNVSRIIRILTAYVVCASICEHTLAVLYSQAPCVVGWEEYYRKCYRCIFDITDFAMWKGRLASLLGFFLASAWNFTDLFLITLSITLSARFKQVNQELESVMHLDMDVKYWTKMRVTYNQLSLLTKLVDNNISTLIWISFSNNLFFVCLQLFHSIEPVQSIPKMLYSTLSLLHLLFRACSVCLTVADVYHRSKTPMAILFSVPSSCYNIEVHRMTLQVALENISLTGCRFFFVNRTLLLTIAGTIATYEIVLLQFRSISQDYALTKVTNCSEIQT